MIYMHRVTIVSGRFRNGSASRWL